MKIQYHGHSCIQLSAGNHSVIIDPFITGNPKSVTELANIQIQYILLTHGHSDHITDAAALAMQNQAPIIAVEELAVHFGNQGLKTEMMHVGGEWEFPFGRVYLTQATHTSSLRAQDGSLHYAGVPVGIVIQMGGYTIYHAGDTGLFGDMKWLGERFNIDVAFLPIGGRFTMGPNEAAQAADWIQAGCVVPIHFDTFPAIQQDSEAFIQALGHTGIRGNRLVPGEVMLLEKNE